jgi:hypothetical protein
VTPVALGNEYWPNFLLEEVNSVIRRWRATEHRAVQEQQKSDCRKGDAAHRWQE